MNKCLEKGRVNESVYLEYIVFTSTRMSSFGSLESGDRFIEQLMMRLKTLEAIKQAKQLEHYFFPSNIKFINHFYMYIL